MENYETLQHEFAPVYRSNAKVLILGTFPSVKSRQNAFYYGHPQNRFWKVLAALTNEPIPMTIEAKKELLWKHQIAIWDVIAQCDIVGSSDSSIKDVIPNNIAPILAQSDIKKIFGNGNKACALYKKYIEKEVGQPIIPLPSTSPANAVCTLDKLIEAWKVIRE